MTNERKAELLKKLSKEIYNCYDALIETDDEEEFDFIAFEKHRLIAELNYSIDYYEEHK